MRWMKTIIIFCVVLIPIIAIGQTVGEREATDYKNALSQYYAQDIAVVNEMSDNGIALEEIPVILFIAQETELPTNKVVTLYKGGQSWENIVNNNNSDLCIFYFSITSDLNSKVYLPIFNKFKGFNSEAVEPMVLSNKEIFDVVNLQFITKHYDFNVFEIMAMRDYGKSFTRINADVKMVKEKLHKEELAKERNAAKAKKATSE